MTAEIDLHPAPASGRAQLRDLSDDVTVELSAGDVARLLEHDEDPELRSRVDAQLERSIRQDADRRSR